MRHTAKAYLIEVLIPAYETFLDHIENRIMGYRQDTQKAANVAEYCLHLADHVFNENKSRFSGTGIKTLREYRTKLFQAYPSYEIICDFANTWKHRNINRDGRKLSSLDSVKEIFGIIRYQDEDGYYYDTKKFVWLMLDDGQIVDAGPALHASLKMWIEELIQLKVIDSEPRFRQPSPKQVSRIQAKTTPMTILGQEELTGEIMMVTFVYHQDKGTFEKRQLSDKFDHTFPVLMKIEESRFDP